MGTGLEEFGVFDDEAGDKNTAEEAIGGSSDTSEEDAALEALPPADPKEVYAAIESIYLFAGLLPAHIDRIAKLAEEVRVKKNEAVFHHGDEGDGLYLVLDGAIRISRNVSGMGEEALAILRDGAHFGEMSLIDDDVPRSADALCHEPARLLKLPKHELRDLMFVDRELAYELLWRFVRGLSSRLRDSNDRLMMLTASSKF